MVVITLQHFGFSVQKLLPTYKVPTPLTKLTDS